MLQFRCMCLALFTVLFSSIIIANDKYICEHDGIKRTLKITNTDVGGEKHCKVVYEKESGAHTLWSSKSKGNFCESKAKSFIEKQRGWGWSCVKTK